MPSTSEVACTCQTSVLICCFTYNPALPKTFKPDAYTGTCQWMRNAMEYLLTVCFSESLPFMIVTSSQKNAPVLTENTKFIYRQTL